MECKFVCKCLQVNICHAYGLMFFSCALFILFFTRGGGVIILYTGGGGLHVTDQCFIPPDCSLIKVLILEHR